MLDRKGSPEVRTGAAVSALVLEKVRKLWPLRASDTSEQWECTARHAGPGWEGQQ